MHRGFTFQLAPTESQAETLGQWVGATRFVYNLALEQRSRWWRQFKSFTGHHINWASQSREVTALRLEYDWIAAVPRCCLEQAVRDLDKAYGLFFRGGGFPGFRNRRLNSSIRFQSKDITVRKLNRKWAMIRLPKIGDVKFRLTHSSMGGIKSATVTDTGRGWSVSFGCEVDGCAPLGDLPSVGIDRGVATNLMLSTGEEIRLPDISAIQKRRRRAQAALARKVKGSQRRARQKACVAGLYARERAIRKDALHRASTSIARRFGVVAIEDLKVNRMVGSKTPRGLNRSILEQGWTMFATMLAYKLEAAGGKLLRCNPAYTSQTCSVCGVIDERSRKSQAVFECVACDHRANADHNAAINILRRSTAWLDVEGSSSDPAKRQLAAAA